MHAAKRWGIALAGIFIQMALGAVYAWSVFRQPLAKHFNCSIPQVTLTFTITIFVLGVLYVQTHQNQFYFSSPCPRGEERSDESCGHGGLPAADRVRAIIGRRRARSRQVPCLFSRTVD